VQYKDADEEFLQQVTENTRCYIGIFAEALDELMPEPTEAYAVDEDRGILMTQRVDEGVDGGADGTDPLQRMPPEIK
jgi:DNA replication licensing factor MCM7